MQFHGLGFHSAFSGWGVRFDSTRRGGPAPEVVCRSGADANLVLFIASEQAAQVSVELMPVDGLARAFAQADQPLQVAWQIFGVRVKRGGETRLHACFPMLAVGIDSLALGGPPERGAERADGGMFRVLGEKGGGEKGGALRSLVRGQVRGDDRQHARRSAGLAKLVAEAGAQGGQVAALFLLASSRMRLTSGISFMGGVVMTLLLSSPWRRRRRRWPQRTNSARWRCASGGSLFIVR